VSDLKPHFKNPKQFKGVYSRDEVAVSETPLQLEDGEYALINQDDEDGPGTHWVGIKRDGNMILYFDSFNLPPPQTIVDWAQEADPKLKLYANQGRRFQHVSSTACGYFVTQFFNTVDTDDDYNQFNEEWGSRTPRENEIELEKIFGI